MDYVLWAYAFVGCAAIYGAVWTAGGQRARLVLSLGAYTYHPSYEPPSRTWRRNRATIHRDRSHDFQGWQEFLDTQAEPMDTEAPTAILPTLVRDEMTEADTGAEHWGGLLGDMTTEERLVYNAAMLETYQETKAVERPALSALDQAVANFHAALAEQELREAAAFEGTWRNLYRSHGGHDRWATGQYAQYQPSTA
jgi:hypothetical protein